MEGPRHRHRYPRPPFQGAVLPNHHHESQPLEIVSHHILTSRCHRTPNNQPPGTRSQRSGQQYSSKDRAKLKNIAPTREDDESLRRCEEATARGSNNVVPVPQGNDLPAHMDSPRPRKSTQELSVPTRIPQKDAMGKGKKIPTKVPSVHKDHCGLEKARFCSVGILPASTRNSRVRL